MRRHFSNIAGLLLSVAAIVLASGMGHAATNPPDAAVPAEPPAILDLGGLDVFSIHSSTGGLSPQDRVDQITSRLTPLLGVPSIPPDSVRIYYLKPGNPSIYVLGRRIVTVDPKTAKSEGNCTTLQLATIWATKLQKVLPQVNYRKPGQPLPNLSAKTTVIVTNNLADVGGSLGEVLIGRKVVMRLRGVQPDGLTAAERADMIRTRLYTAMRSAELAVDNTPPATNTAVSSSTTTTTPNIQTPQTGPPSTTTTTTTTVSTTTNPATTPVANDPVQVVPLKPAGKVAVEPVELIVDGATIITVDRKQAISNDQPSPAALANSWGNNIRAALTAEEAPVATPQIIADPLAPPVPSTTSPSPTPIQTQTPAVKATSPASAEAAPSSTQ